MRRALAIGLLALLLRLAQAGCRWDEVALAYSAYPTPAAMALAAGQPGALLGAWVGLHPPLFSALSAFWENGLPVPALLLGAGALGNALGAALLARREPLAGLALATAPAAVLYAGEWNNYPLAAGLIALCLAAAEARWGWLAAGVILAGQAHLLAGIAGIGVLAWRLVQEDPRGERGKLVGAVLLGLLPVGVGALLRLGQPSTFAQPEFALEPWVEGLTALCGGPGLLLLLFGLGGLRGAAAAAMAAAGGFYALTLALGVTAPHQFPYVALLLPIFAAGVGGLRGRIARGIALALILGQGLGLAVDLADRIGAIAADQREERAIDAALEASRAGDLLWLVSPALQGDDDKRATAPVLWRLSPFSAMPIAQRTPFDQTDWRWGQPRSWRGRVVHSSTELDAARFDAIAAAQRHGGHDLFVLLYDHGPARGLEERVRRVLGIYEPEERRFPREEGLGDDLLWVIR